MKRKIISVLLMLLVTVMSIGVPTATVHAEAGTERKSLQVSKTLTPPKIDGIPDESVWQGRVSVPIGTAVSGRGFNGTQANAGMLWDNTYLYITVDVKETVPDFVYNGSGYWFDQDNINIFLDPTSHQSSPYITNDMQVGFVYQPNSTTPEFHFGAALNGHAGKDEKKILRAIHTNDSGWTCEVAIPWDMLSFDPYLTKSLGVELTVTDRDSDGSEEVQAWSAFNSSSFWNDTSGYGKVILSDTTVSDSSMSNVLLQDDFNGYNTGDTPDYWISDVNSGSPAFSIVKSTNNGVENSALVFDGCASGKQARITAPVQWDNYTVEADVCFESVLNDSRWASLMFRVPANGKNPYNQMAVRRTGDWEIAYRDANNSWIVPFKGRWSKGALALNNTYTMKARVFDQNVKEYIKAKGDTNYDLLTDQTLPANLLERGKVGFQADQSKVSFDNIKVTRLLPTNVNSNIPFTMEALTGPITPSFTADFSDGVSGEPVSAKNVKMYSSDESIMKIIDGKLYTVKVGDCTIKLVYYNAEKDIKVTVTPSSAGVKITSISYAKGYILGTKGTPIKAADIKFHGEYNDFTQGEITGDQCQWSFDNPGIVQYENGEIQVLAQGKTTATVTKDGISTTVLLITRQNAADSFILYEENFDSLSDGAVPQGWTRKEGTTASRIGVKSGAFEIDARTSPDNPTRILLPDYLNMFGNYTIEADVTNLSANDTARWNSLMYRIKNNDYPYYQMAVRKDATATNGVEFAERTPSNTWNVMTKASFTEPIDAGKMYHYTIKAYANRVQQYINDSLLIDTDLAGSHLIGGIGLQANGSVMKIDNIKITLLETPIPALVKPEDKYARVVEADTKIAMAPSVVAEIATSEDFKNVVSQGTAATAILNINKNLEVMGNGTTGVIGTVKEMYELMQGKVIPAFRVEDADTVNAVMAYLKLNAIEDAFIISRTPELVKQARSIYPIIRGVVEFDNVPEEASATELMNIRNTANSNLARIAVIPAEAATKSNVQYLQQRLITVWTRETTTDDTSNNRLIALHKMITAGANGMVTAVPDMAKQALAVYNHDTTIVRKPFLIGHRGVPDLAPENTMEGSELAFTLGADMVENDIYPTKAGTDGEQHLVVMHDSTIDRTTNGSGYVSEMTLEELETYLANKQFPLQYPNAKIPTLDQYFEKFTGKDQVIFIELKSYDPVTVDLYTDLIRKMGVEDHVVAISFSGDQLKRTAAQMPEMSLGWLCGGIANESDVYGSLRSALQQVQTLNSVFSTSYYGLGKEFMEASKHRGMTIWPWTFTDKATIIKYFKLGIYGMTTNCAEMYSDWAADIIPMQSQVAMEYGKSVSLQANVKTYKGDLKEITPDVVVLSGADNIEVNGNTITSKRAGEAYVTLRYTAKLSEAEGDTYDIYTQPVKIQIKEDTVPPVITVNGINDGDVVKLNQNVVVTWSCSDEASGVETSAGDIASGEALDTSKVGPHTLTFTATDKAGNKTIMSITYNVQYNWSGVLKPIEADGSKVFNLGSTVPVKFRLTDAKGENITDAAVKLYLAEITGDMTGPEFEAASASSAINENVFKYDSTDNQYIFNLSTKNLKAGVYQIRIDLGDGSTNIIKINLK